MRDFKKYKVWEKSHQLTLDIYRLTNDFPAEEKFGLISQIRRACASIPTNISEGCGYESTSQFVRFLQIAAGSCSEVEYLIMLSTDLKYLSENSETLLLNCQEIKKMLFGLINKIKAED